MSSLKVIKSRIRSVDNTKKISQTMRLVSAAKYARAEKELIAIRPFGYCPQQFFEAAELMPAVESKSQLFLAVSGDRGLCGAIHSGVSRAVGTAINELAQNESKLICIGKKNKIILSRSFSDKIIWVASNIGKKPITFIDAGRIAEKIMETMEKHLFSRTRIFYNKYINAASYRVEAIDFYDNAAIHSAPKFALYDDINEDMMDFWLQFALATIVFWILKEGSTSELSARMIAMESATRNASDMIKLLTLQYNRTRQAVITRELIEIISGASAIQ